MPPSAVALLGASVAFYLVFSVFLAAFVVLTVITLTWAVRRDRAGRRAWVERRQREGSSSSPEFPAPPPGSGPGSNGRRSPPARKGSRRR